MQHAHLLVLKQALAAFAAETIDFMDAGLLLCALQCNCGT
jgi:hypothetical protein